MGAGRYYLGGKYIKGYEKAWYSKSVQLLQLWDGIIKVISLERDYFTRVCNFYISYWIINYVPRLNPIPKATAVSNELLVSIMREGNGTKF